MTDVRVGRTRLLVIAAVRELLANDGAAAVTYSSVARRSGSTRQTLYRHWPTIAALMADSVLAGPPASIQSQAMTFGQTSSGLSPA